MDNIDHYHETMQLPQSPTFNVLHPRKFKGGIHSGSHLVLTNGGELLYFSIFFEAKSAMQA